MSVYPAELDFYGCANMPEADGATVGGAVDFSKRIFFSDPISAGLFDAVSSSTADTATKLTLSGRDGTGTMQTQAFTLNGSTLVAGTQSFQRLLAAAASGAGTGGPLANPGGTAAAGDVAVLAHTRLISAHTAQAGSASHSGITPPLFKLAAGDGTTAGLALEQIVYIHGGTGAGQVRRIVGLPAMWGTDTVAVNADWTTVPDATSVYDIAPGMLFEKANAAGQQTTQLIRHFAGTASAAPGGGTTTYYEKIFAVNGDAVTSLTSASIVKQTDPAGLYAAGAALDLALCSALNDTGTVANRQTAPATGIGAFSSGAAPQTLSAANNLPAGAAPNAAGAQGIWLRYTLPAGMSPLNSPAVYEAAGQTT